jgi:thiosulfate reductase/polysulfide reductase chain A
MNAAIATQQGLLDNDWVEVTSQVGKVNVRLQATEAIRPDCVYLTPGYGHLSRGLTTAFGIGASDPLPLRTPTRSGEPARLLGQKARAFPD